ncbi:F-box/kelch-repeat protein At3g23880-like [Lycium ferocissimum]|uniref:F-box/kelch-repeat protein At3g23880-like n=1 Tax=Lycium ferocissimum TaxID=112874 RepID=UPI002814DEFF|nr:F-box/kelch-repeat protein At3g23880-like [Lycium ferocissimum]
MKPKQSKPTKGAQFSATSMQDSSFKIPVLPVELIMEILLKIPVKSLLQFRCVSKSWLSLISSPEFIKTHLSISANNNNDYNHHRIMFRLVEPEFNLKDCSLKSLLYDSVTRSFDLDYPMKPPHKPVEIVGSVNNSIPTSVMGSGEDRVDADLTPTLEGRKVEIVGSVNGLICLAIDKEGWFLWNPSLRKFKKLSDSGTTFSGRHYAMHGFGYDELHNDYKVVGISRILGSDNSRHVELKTCSLKSDSTRIIHDFHIGVQIDKCGVFVNGRLHWANNTSHRLRSYNGWDIICFDLADGKLGKVEKPSYGDGDFDFTPCPGALGSDLCLFCDNRGTQADVDIWVMKTYGVKESWTKIFTINRPKDHPAGYLGYLFCPPFCMSNKGEVLCEFGATIMIYNPKDDSIRYAEVTNCEAFSDAAIYIESLVWPFCQKEPRMQVATTSTQKAR